jgi:hypothetical protein
VSYTSLTDAIKLEHVLKLFEFRLRRSMEESERLLVREEEAIEVETEKGKREAEEQAKKIVSLLTDQFLRLSAL